MLTNNNQKDIKMNKLLTALAVSAVALSASAAHVKTGWNTTLTGGFSQNKMKTKGLPGTTRNKSKNSGSFNLGLRLGHTWAMQEKYFAGVNLLAGYNFGDEKFTEEAGQWALHHKPRFNFGLGLVGGTCVSETVNTYLALNFLREQSRVTTKFADGTPSNKDNFRTYTLTPLLGVNGRISEKMSWLAEAGYKFNLSKSGLKKTFAPGTYNKNNIKGPKGFVANVGVTYHF